MAVKTKGTVAGKKPAARAKAAATNVKKKPAAPAKAVATKKAAAVKKTVVKKAAARKPARKISTSVGDKYICDECGLIVTVSEICDCAGVCDIFCCEEHMKLIPIKR